MAAITWTQQTSSFGADIIWDVDYNGSDLWVAVGSSAKLATSPDGENWTQRDVTAIFNSGDQIDVVVYGGGVWVIASRDTGKIATSLNGLAWTEQAPAGASAFFDGAYGNGIFVLVGGGTRIQTSNDGGVTWISRTTSIATFVSAVGYDSLNNLWVVGGFGGIIETSSDAINWVSQGVQFGINPVGISSNQSNLWIGVDAWKLKTSPDAITWSEPTHPIIVPQCVGYNGSDLWCVGGDIILSSPVGVTWTLESEGFGGSRIYNIVHNQVDLWVAVGADGKLATGVAILPEEYSSIYDLGATRKAFWLNKIAKK